MTVNRDALPRDARHQDTPYQPMYLAFFRGCRCAPHVQSPLYKHTTRIWSSLWKGPRRLICTDAQSMCCPPCLSGGLYKQGELFTSKPKKGCFLPFLSSHKASPGKNPEYFMERLKDPDGSASIGRALTVRVFQRSVWSSACGSAVLGSGDPSGPFCP